MLISDDKFIICVAQKNWLWSYFNNSLNSEDVLSVNLSLSLHQFWFSESSEGHKVELGYKDYNYDDADEETELIRAGYFFRTSSRVACKW